MSNSFLCYLYSILKKYLSVVSYYFCVVFVLSLLHLSVCFVCFDLFHILLLLLQTYGAMECVCVCVT
jgi:hypothetical protein